MSLDHNIPNPSFHPSARRRGSFCLRISPLVLGFLRLIAPDGRFLDPDESIVDCGLRQGDACKVWKNSGFVFVLIVASSVLSEQSDLEVS